MSAINNAERTQSPASEDHDTTSTGAQPSALTPPEDVDLAVDYRVYTSEFCIEH